MVVFVGENELVYISESVSSARGVCQRLEQSVTFQTASTRQPPVTSSTLPWHVKTLKAPRQTPAPAQLSLYITNKAHTGSLTCPTNGSTQSCQPYIWSHMSLWCELSVFPSSSLFLYLSPFFFPQSHGNTLSRINLLRLDWWPTGLLLTKALPNMVSYWEIMLSCHSIWDGDPLCQSWSLAVVTTVPPSLPLWPDAACRDSRCHYRSDKCIPMSSGFSSSDQY